MQNHGIVKMTPFSGWTAVTIGIVFFLTSGALGAQSTVSVTGKVTSLKGQGLVVETKQRSRGGEAQRQNGNPRRASDQVFRHHARDVCWRIAAKQPDGTFRASRLHVFSEDQRGTGEGHRPLSSAPGSGLTMTNANIETVEDVAVQNVQGRLLLLKYKGGEIRVLVPADTLVVKRVIGDSTWLKSGATLAITASRAEDGAMTATQITVRAPIARGRVP